MISPDICILVRSKRDHQKAKAAKLSRQLGLPLVEDLENDFKYLFVYTDYCLELQQNPRTTEYNFQPIYVDFLQRNKIISRITSTSVKSPLAKAVGIKANKRPAVIDATAGLGIDGISLAWLGCKVTLIERSPIIHALLNDGIERAALQPEMKYIIQNNVVLICDNAIDVLTNHDYQSDTVFVDPMYPLSRKAPMNKKEMRVLRDIVGDDIDSDKLFSVSLEYAKNRVVVKRPKGGKIISETPRPSHQILMKSGRFDVYLTHISHKISLPQL